MMLLTFNEWLGPGKKCISAEIRERESRNKTVAFATHLLLPQALLRVKNYQDVYNEHYYLAVNFTLLSVSISLDPVREDLLDFFGVQFVEKLPKTPEEFS